MCYRYLDLSLKYFELILLEDISFVVSLSDRKVWCANRDADFLSVEHFQKIEHSLCSPATYGGLRVDELSELGMNMCASCVHPVAQASLCS